MLRVAERVGRVFPGVPPALGVCERRRLSGLGPGPGENGYTPETAEGSGEEGEPTRGERAPPEIPGQRPWEEPEHGNQAGGRRAH